MALPLARAFALACCAHKRNGGKFDGADYKTLDLIDRMRASNV